MVILATLAGSPLTFAYYFYYLTLPGRRLAPEIPRRERLYNAILSISLPAKNVSFRIDYARR